MNIQDLINFFLAHGPGWVRSQRALQRPRGRPLSDGESRALTPFFAPNTLATVRLVAVPTIPNPDFYSLLAAQGIPIPLDFTQMSGITFEDTILISQSRPVEPPEWLPLLFHELVHVVQYELLGLDEFVRRYVTGWAQNGFRYNSIPLEHQAYELDARFRSSPNAPFLARLEIARQLGYTNEVA